MSRKAKGLTLAQVDFRVGFFTGPLKFKDTGLPKLCDVCGKDRATWKHAKKKSDRRGEYPPVYLCFGCGDH